jgi:DNA modification methylase
MSELSYTLLRGHVLDRLRELPADSVQCCVTSPPYYGLRAYPIEPQVWGGDPLCDHSWDEQTYRLERHGDSGSNHGLPDASSGAHEATRIGPQQSATCTRCGAWRGHLGSESSIGAFIAHLVEVFREVKRVLRPDGTLWINVGDSYHAGTSASRIAHHDPEKNHNYWNNTAIDRRVTAPECKPKDMLLVPFRLAIALQEDGWYVRSDICWAKPNPMPGSQTDRPTSAHEYIFLLSKQPNYYYDHVAIRVGAVSIRSHHGKDVNPKAQSPAAGAHANPSWTAAVNGTVQARNLRDVWSIAPAPGDGWDYCRHCQTLMDGAERQAIDKTKLTGDDGKQTTVKACPGCGATDGWVNHFAAFPLELPRTCLKAGTSAFGACGSCGAPYERVVERVGRTTADVAKEQGNSGYSHGQDGTGRRGQSLDFMGHHGDLPPRQEEHLGWAPTCRCAESGQHPDKYLDIVSGYAPDSIRPCTVVDIFAGSGSSGIAALELGLHPILIELSDEYAEVCEARLARAADRAANPLKPAHLPPQVRASQLDLFAD